MGRPWRFGLALAERSANLGLTSQRLEELITQIATPVGSGVLLPDAYKAVLAALKKIPLCK